MTDRTEADAVTLDELESALLGADAPQPLPAWLAGLTRGAAPVLPLEQLCEVAAEEHPHGPLATIQALLQGLIIRHQGDDATVAALVAIERLHLPALVEHRAQQ